MRTNQKLNIAFSLLFIGYGGYILITDYTRQTQGQSIILAMSILVFAAVLALIFLEGGRKMAEEKKESKTERIMLTMSSKLKEALEKKAEELGISTTQYIMNLIINDMKPKK